MDTIQFVWLFCVALGWTVDNCGCNRTSPTTTTVVSAASTTSDFVSRDWFSNRSVKTGVVAEHADRRYFILDSAAPRQDGVRSASASGYLADVVDRISRLGSFRVDWTVERSAGKRRRDGSWTGLMGRVITADLELGVAVVTPQHGLDQRLTHTQPFLETTLTLLVGGPLSSRLHVRGPDPALYLEDLVNGTLTPGVVNGSRVEQVIRRSGNQLYRDVWRRIVGVDAAAGATDDSSAPDSRPTPSSTSGLVRSLEDGVERVRRDADFVLIVESTDAARVTHRPPGCELTAIDQLLPVARHLFVASAAFETSLRRLDARLTRLREDRVLDELYAKWWQKNECWNRTLVDDVAAAGVGGPDAWSTGGPPAIDAETDGMERIFLESPITWRPQTTPATSDVVATSPMSAGDDVIEEVGVVTDAGEKSTPPSDHEDDDGQRRWSADSELFYSVATTPLSPSQHATVKNKHHQRRSRRPHHRRHSTSALSIVTTTSASSPSSLPAAPKSSPYSHRLPDDDDDVGLFHVDPRTSGLLRPADPDVRGRQRSPTTPPPPPQSMSRDLSDEFAPFYVTHQPLPVPGDDVSVERSVDVDGTFYGSDVDDANYHGEVMTEQEMAVKDHWRQGTSVVVARATKSAAARRGSAVTAATTTSGTSVTRTDVFFVVALTLFVVSCGAL